MRIALAALFTVLLMSQVQAPLNKSYAPAVRPTAKRVQLAEKPAAKPSQQTQAEQTPPAPTPAPAVETVAAVQTPDYTNFSHADLLSAAGIAPSDYQYVDYIVSHESSWNQYATEPTTGAYGECQSLPASKMATAGDDWQTNPVTQLKWCNAYAQERYGSWAAAYTYWVNHRNW